VTVGVDDLTRDMVRRADEATQDLEEREGENAVFAQVLVAELFGVRHVPNEADWYDLRHPDRGTKYEVKAAQTTIDGLVEDERVPVDGRFRVWKGQTRSLINAAAAEGQSAWYVFLLLDGDGDPLELRRVQPSTVWRWTTERFGGWDDSGHDNPDRNQQQKLPYGVVFS
jgi:hypothetical protein